MYPARIVACRTSDDDRSFFLLSLSPVKESSDSNSGTLLVMMSSSTGDVIVLASWCDAPLPPSELTVEVCSTYNRRANPTIDAWIDETWKSKWEAVQRQGGSDKVLFNGTKFRLAGIRHDLSTSNGTGPLLQLGITDYRSSIGCGEHFDAIQRVAFEADGAPGDEAGALLSSALGIESLLITDDGYAVLFQRSEHVAEYPGYFCCPGGHPEPKHILRTASWPSLEAQADWFSHMQPSIVVGELYGSAIDEIHDELGVPKCHLVNAGLLGVVRNASNLKPDLVFAVRTNLTAEDVQKIYRRGTQDEAFESEAGTPLLVVSLATDEVERILATHRITPPSQACLTMGLKYAQSMQTAA